MSFEVDQFAEGYQGTFIGNCWNLGWFLDCGGDTLLAAIDSHAAADQIGYISTGGGAFLEFVEGKTLPAVAVLFERVIRDLTL